MGPTKHVQIGAAQKEYLLNFMMEHNDIAVYTRQAGSAVNQEREDMWQELATGLNAIGTGTKKNVTAWKICWTGWKTKTKKKANGLRKYLNGTGGSEVPAAALTPIEEQLLDLIGYLDDPFVPDPLCPEYGFQPAIDTPDTTEENPIVEVHVSEGEFAQLAQQAGVADDDGLGCTETVSLSQSPVPNATPLSQSPVPSAAPLSQAHPTRKRKLRDLLRSSPQSSSVKRHPTAPVRSTTSLRNDRSTTSLRDEHSVTTPTNEHSEGPLPNERLVRTLPNEGLVRTLPNVHSVRTLHNGSEQLLPSEVDVLSELRDAVASLRSALESSASAAERQAIATERQATALEAIAAVLNNKFNM